MADMVIDAIRQGILAPTRLGFRPEGPYRYVLEIKSGLPLTPGLLRRLERTDPVIHLAFTLAWLWLEQPVDLYRAKNASYQMLGQYLFGRGQLPGREIPPRYEVYIGSGQNHVQI